LIDRPRHPLLPVESHLSAWQAETEDAWRAVWRPGAVPVRVKVWRVPPGVSGAARLDLRQRAITALGDATPEVFWCGLVDDAVVSVTRWERGAAPRVPLDPTGPEATRWMDALARLHDAGLVHRDVCARNTLCTPDGRLLVLDLDEVMTAGVDADVVGSPGYVAPEVAAGGAATPAADLYSFAQDLLRSRAPVMVRLASAPEVECRATSVAELQAALPLPTEAPGFHGALLGPDALHDIPARAQTLRGRKGGQAALDRLCAVGFGQPGPGGARVLHPTDLHRWQALVEPDGSLPANRARVEAGEPGLAVWSLLCRVKDGSQPSTAWVDLLGAAALHTHDPRVLRRVYAELACRGASGGEVGWWCALLGAALAAYAGRGRAALEVVSALAVPPRLEARRAREVVWFRVALGLGLGPARAALTALCQDPLPEDPEASARRRCWQGLLAYRSGAASEAVAWLESAWPERTYAHEAALAASNLVAVWLHLDEPARGEAVAKQALSRLTPGAHPFASARLAAKLREAVYRGHVRPAPDPDTLAAIRVSGPPFAVALATLNEAGAAWRSGQNPLAGALADEAARRFEKAGMEAGHTLAGALAHRLEHPAWIDAADRLEAAVDRMVDRASGVWLPALAAQVLGLLASGPEDPLAQDAWELAQESGLPPGPRREVLSLQEAGQGGPST